MMKMMKPEHKLALKYTWLDFWYASRESLLLLAVGGAVLFCFFYPVIALYIAGAILTIGLILTIIVTYSENLERARQELENKGE